MPEERRHGRAPVDRGMEEKSFGTEPAQLRHLSLEEAQRDELLP